VEVTEEMIAAARGELPELPAERATRFRDELGLRPDTARCSRPDDWATTSRPRSRPTRRPAAARHWVTNELVRNVGDSDPADSKLSP